MTVDLTESRPYKKMASTCRTRPIQQKRVVWTKVESEPFDQGRYQVKALRSSLVKSAAELWRLAYPELYGSPHEFLLDPDRYEPAVALEETWVEDAAKKVHCMPVVVELETERVISASLLTKYEMNLQVEFSFVGTHPKFRRRSLTDQLRKATMILDDVFKDEEKKIEKK